MLIKLFCLSTCSGLCQSTVSLPGTLHHLDPSFLFSLFPRCPLLKLLVLCLHSPQSSLVCLTLDFLTLHHLEPSCLFSLIFQVLGFPYLIQIILFSQILYLLNVHLQFIPSTTSALITFSLWNLTRFEIHITLTFISCLTSKIPRLRLLIFCLV